MTVPVRWDVVRQAKLCYQCLGPHLLRACHSTRCPWCGGPHHSSLHPPPGEHAALMPTERCVPDRGPLSPPAAAAVSESRMPDRRPLPPPAAAGTFSANQGRMCMGVRSQQHCYVQTALVEVAGPRGVRLVRALIDGGADASFIRASLADQLGLEKVGQGTFACVGFKERVEEAHQYDQVSARLTGYQKGEAELVFWRTDKLCAPVGAPPPIQSLPPSVELADDFRDGPVDVLIGCDQLYKVVLWNQVEVNPGLRLVETVFGYVLHGQSPGQQTTRQRHAYRCQLVDVERMWTLDAVGVAAEETAERDPPVPTWNATENRYEMGLVWKSDQRPVSNLMLSKTRTHRMTEKLNVEQFQEYDDHLHQLLEDAVIEPALPSPPSEFILPHRGLHRNGKLRVVFDGSAPDGAGMSLNSYLEPGENLLHRLPAVLLNFRSGAVGCQTDIRAAFHQIVLTEEDRQFVQLLWAGQRLRFRRVPFGLTCSPYMLLCTIAEHVRRCLRDEPVLLQKVQDSVYMDDMCPSFSTRAEAEAGLTKMGDVFSEASMDLHKTRMSGDDTEDEKVLGLLWSTRSDRLAVTVPQVTCPGTRTELLSAVSRPFDPLGVVTPWLIWGKALFQRTWLDAQCTWDSPLSGELQTEVRAWWRDSPGRVIWFPRLAGARDDQSGATFHVFCDASRTAYCAVVYVVQGGEPALVMSKSRLAPLSPHLTIPRLELMAAVVGARLMDFIKNALHLESATVTYWSDSTDVLHWLNRRRPLKMFVENRVKTVLQLTTADQWRYVRGSDNPADIGTRGVTLTSLIACDKWWKGPPFDLSPPDYDASLVLLTPPSAEAEAETRPEVRRQVVAVRRECGPDPIPDVMRGPFDVTRCSHLKQAVNRTAWILRFAHNARHQRTERRSGALSPEERREALLFWIRVSQSAAYAPELEALTAGAPLPPNSRLEKVRPRLNADGVLEAVTRTHEPALIILPEFAHLTTLIVDDAHRKSFHQGTRTTLALLSGEYCVRRRTVHRVVSTCFRCRRYRGAPYRSADGALPPFRTEPSRPFSRVGVDFFGPMYVKGGDKVTTTC
ncbi:uncharacterized protein LOC122374128 isoform X1 [Amphibalanus amphitrite]|uniref:uncharacterized protein LOC122374128 isoform X1 n=1 Tax=Amphibalanus amphitrite TaxID=1232801 RepID=UPI001C922EB7|nr:uncharacterized protein LOC122374128 isoform X1 [Amphibalanus amphitrite]